MTPKEKAKELIAKFSAVGLQQRSEGVQCALIAVDEMIIQNGEIYLMQFGEKAVDFYRLKNNYLFEVKQEIEKL